MQNKTKKKIRDKIKYERFFFLLQSKKVNAKELSNNTNKLMQLFTIFMIKFYYLFIIRQLLNV